MSGGNLTLEVTGHDNDDAYSNQIDKIELDIGNGYTNVTSFTGNTCERSGRTLECTGIVIPVTESISPMEVRVTDRKGASQTKSFNVTLATPPAVTLSATNTSPFIDESVTLTATASHASGLQEYKICRAPGNYTAINNGCVTAVKTCSTNSSPCTVNLAAPGWPGQFTYYAYAVTNQGVANAFPQVINYANFFGIYVIPPTSSSYVIGRQPLRFTVLASAFSRRTANGELPKLTSLTLYRNGSPVSDGIYISPAIDNLELPLASSAAEAMRISFSWNPSNSDAGDNIELTLVATDNDGHSSRARLPGVRLIEEIVEKPAVPELQLKDLGAGLIEVSFSQFRNTSTLNMRATLDGAPYPMKASAVNVHGKTSYITTVQTKIADHGKQLRVYAYGTRIHNRELIKGEEGSSEPITVVNHETKSHAPVFNSDITQAGGHFTLNWVANTDGVTQSYKLAAWKGLPSDRFSAPHSVLTTTTGTSYQVTDVVQGHYTYEIRACNSQGVCTAGQQHTVEHIAPYIDTAKIEECGAECTVPKAKVTVSGVGFSASQSALYARLRGTGDTFYISPQDLSLSGYTLTGTLPEIVHDALLDNGVEITITNGVLSGDAENNTHLENTIILDETGSAQRPNLRGREFTVSENKVLYVGGEEGGLKAHKVNLDGDLQYLWTYPESDPQNVSVTAKPLVRPEPISDTAGARKIDNIYFGSLNHHFYRLTYDPIANLEVTKKWQFQTQGEIRAGAQFNQNDALLIGSMDEALYSLDAKTGLANWHYEFPQSGGVVMPPQVSASGHIYVTTADREVHVIDQRMIGANAVKWHEIGALALQFEDEIKEWETQWWHPDQNTDDLVILTKAMLILLQRTPSKTELSFMAYLMANGHPLNEMVNALINIEPSLSESSNAQFISTLFEYLLLQDGADQVLSGATYGSGDQAYWVGILEMGVTRADVIIDLLGESNRHYEDATFNLLKYFYGHCLVSDYCDFDYDSDKDGLSDRVEEAIGTNSADHRDGLQSPTLIATEQSGIIDFTLSAPGRVEEYQLYALQPGNPQYQLLATLDADKTTADNVGSLSKIFKHNGSYQFKALACVKLPASLADKVVSRCSNNYSNEELITITSSAVEGSPSVALPSVDVAQKQIPSESVLLAHARLQPTTGSFRVTESGAASYSVPIALPVGITGVQPEVSLNYSSQGGDGLVALGWSLGAASGISRCRQTKAQDGQFKGLTLSEDDRYCLDGQRLISKAVKTHSGSFEGEQIADEFMTEIDAQITVYKLGQGSQSQFVVLAKDGSVKRYGASDTSRTNLTDADGVVHTTSWMLSEVKDNLGHESTTIHYEYTELVDPNNSANSEKVLSEIIYSGNRVVFTHEAGALRHAGYVDTAKVIQFARLSNIEVFNHHGAELAHYDLDFVDATNGTRLLQSVAHCRGSVCRAPVSFIYDTFASKLDFEAFSNVYSKERMENALSSVTLADLKATGLAQLVTLEQTDKGAKRYTLCVYQGHTYQAAEELACRDIYRKDDQESVSMFAIDHDLDGRQTLMINMRSEHTSDANPGYWAHYALSDNNQLQSLTLPEGWPANHYMREIKPADLNGDGYADLVYKHKKDDPNLYVRLADPETKAFGHQYVLGTDVGDGSFYGYGDFTSKGTDWHVIDMNFDGLADIVALKCDSTHCNNDDAKRLAVHYNQGETGYGGLNPFLTETIASDEKIELLTPSDVNGDGLVDLMYLATPTYNHDVKQWHVQLNQSGERVKFTKVFIATAKSSNDTLSVSELIPPMSMDIDKNGKADLFFKEKKTKKWRRYEWSIQDERFTKVSDNAFELAVDTRGGDFAFFSDYDGNGVADILIKHDYGVSVRYNLSQRPTAGMLLEVNQGYTGHTNNTTIHYGLMSDRAVYTDLNDDLTTDSGIFNTQELLVSKMTGSGVLVASVETDSPSNRSGALSTDKAIVDYHYQGARVQFGGRGPLGFKTLKTTTQKDGKTFETTTRYHQAFPFTGMPYSTQKRMKSAGTNELLSISVNEYSKQKTQQLNGVTAYRVYNSDSRECSAAVDSGMSVSVYTCTDTTTLQDTYGNVKNLTVNTYDVGASGAEHFTSAGATGTVQHSVVTESQYGTTEEHQRLGRLSETKVTYSGAGLDAISKTSYFEYYPQNHAHENMLHKEVVGKGLGCEYELTTEHSYDNFGNKVKVESENTACTGLERETRTSETIFDAQGRYVLYTKKSGSKSTLSLISEKVRTVEMGQHTLTRRNAFGQPLELIDSNGVLTYLTYDHFGGKVGSYRTTGAQAYSYFTACGSNENCVVRLNKEVNGVLREKHLLDKLGRTYSVSKLTVLENQWLTSDYQFDRYGRNDVVTEAGSQAVTNTYDALDRVTNVYDANSGTNSDTTFEGRKSTVTVSGSDIRDQVKSTLSNTIGQTVQVIDNINHTLDYTYNALGAQLTVHSSAEATNNSLVSSITYDNMGRKKSVQDSDRGYWQYTYSAFGELRKQTDARGVELTMDYDFLGRKIKQEQIAPEGVFAEGTSTWVYGDTSGTVHRLISSTQGSGWGQTYYYDRLGRAAATLTSLDGTSQCAGQVSFVGSTGDLRITDGSNLDPIDNLCVIQQSFYDSYSRLALQFDDYRRDEQGNFIEARGVAMTYQNGQLLAKTEARNSSKGQVYYKVTALNARGQVTTYEKGGVTMNISYDQKGMVEKISDSNFAIQNDVYSFDSLGNLKSRKQIGMDTRNYHYDDMNRVLGVNNVDLFKYSASGNLIEKADYLIGTDVDCPGYEGSSVLVLGRWTQRYNEDNTPLHAISSRSRIASSSCLGTLPAKTESFSYDANGNQTARSGSDGTTSIEYSARNKAVEITGNGETVTFRYDANNRRYKRVDGSNTVYYVGALELTKPKGEDGKPVINRYIGNDAQQTYFDTGMSKTKWLFTDHQGSTIVVTNSEHTVLTRYAYDIFGKQREVEQNTDLIGEVFNNISDNLRAYTGHEPVSLGGDKRIIHMNGRIYDSETGRFMQADPFVQAPSNLQNYNAYSYVLNNPLSYTDPSGYLFSALKGVSKFLKKNWRVIAAAAATYFTAGAAAGWANSWAISMGMSQTATISVMGSTITATAVSTTGSIVAGAISGAIAGAVGGYIATGSGKGAWSGALSGAVFGGIGKAMSAGGITNPAAQMGIHAVAGGVLSDIQGRNFGHGFVSAGIMKGVGKLANGPSPGRVVLQAIAGGTVSRITGGKFANGATTAAIQFVVNELSTHVSSNDYYKRLASKWNSKFKQTKFERVVNATGKIQRKKGPFAVSHNNEGETELSVELVSGSVKVIDANIEHVTNLSTGESKYALNISRPIGNDTFGIAPKVSVDSTYELGLGGEVYFENHAVELSSSFAPVNAFNNFQKLIQINLEASREAASPNGIK
ncbi:SpvB/TcaC N-terminal domain-containing protein [Pseudoalteromonas sp. R96]|nr:SpvB/TcaC N-terminal domain-containing protein [Pseudoalteromonas sp. R96]